MKIHSVIEICFTHDTKSKEEKEGEREKEEEEEEEEEKEEEGRQEGTSIKGKNGSWFIKKSLYTRT
jgi:hypothetical protein